MEKKYTIEVSEDCVEITGTLTVREAFDFLSFFEKEGFTTLEDWGERTTLYLRKRDLERERKDEIIRNSVEDLEDYKNRYIKETHENEDLKEKIRNLEMTIKHIMTEENTSHQALKKRNETLEKACSLARLKEHPISNEIVMEYLKNVGSESEVHEGTIQVV
jgi:Xaa-Pro aminopeptidase